MFCHKCGAKLPDDAAFCSKCGTKLVVAEQRPNSEGERRAADSKPIDKPQPKRQKSSSSILAMSQLSREQLIELMEPLDRQYAEIQAYEEDIAAGKQGLKRCRGKYSLSMFLTTFACCVSLWCLGASLVGESWDWGIRIAAIIGSIIAAVMLGFAYVAYRNYEGNVGGVMRELNRAIQQDANAMVKVRKAMQPSLLAFPSSCRNAEANAYMLQMLVCGRADSFNEAIDLWETYEHRQHMENFEREKVQEAKNQTIALGVSAVSQVVQAHELHQQNKNIRDIADTLRRNGR